MLQVQILVKIALFTNHLLFLTDTIIFQTGLRSHSDQPASHTKTTAFLFLPVTWKPLYAETCNN